MSGYQDVYKKRREMQENHISLDQFKKQDEELLYRGPGILTTKERTYLSTEERFPSAQNALPVFSVTTAWYRDSFIPQMAQQYIHGGQIKDIEKIMRMPIRDYGHLCDVLAENPGTIIPMGKILQAAREDPVHSRIEIHSPGRAGASKKFDVDR